MPHQSRLHREDFIDAAIELARTDGLDGLTLRAIGTRLGVDSTAIYRHFPSKEMLLVAILDRHLCQAFAPLKAESNPRRQVEEAAATIRRVLMDHPPLSAAVSGLDEYSGGAPRFLEIVVEALEAMGLDGDDLVAHAQLLENYVIGATFFDVHGSPNNWESRRAGFARVASKPFRLVSRSDRDVSRVSDLAFETGLRMILDGCEAVASVTVGS